MNTKATLFPILIFLSSVDAGRAQFSLPAPITNSSPEVCGGSTGLNFTIPNQPTVPFDKSTDPATLPLVSPGVATEVPAPDTVMYVEQVCPISKGRVVGFGYAYQGRTITILDTGTGVSLDQMFGVNPMMSPDQHWIAYEEFYLPRAEVSSKYWIYDLTKDASHNRSAGTPRDEDISVGRVVYPVVAGSGDSAHKHRALAGTFAWAPDSGAVAFADEVDGKPYVVLISTGGGESIGPRVSLLTAAQVCSTPEDVSNPSSLWKSLKLEVTSGPNRAVTVTVKGVQGCVAAPLRLYYRDFEAAPIEESAPPKKDIRVESDPSEAPES